jgi:hypothetical protein
LGEGKDTIVQINHPRDALLGYFDQFKFNSETLQVPGQSGLLAPQVSTREEFAGENFSWDFDAIEIINGKQIEESHNYRVPEELPPAPLPEVIPPAGEIVRDENGEIAFYGVADDWMSLLEAGKVFTGVANSDSHKRHRVELGYPRTWVGVSDDKPGQVSHEDIVSGLRAHNAVMSYCPFVKMDIEGIGIGGTVQASEHSVTVAIDVQTSTWCRPDKINIYVGRNIAKSIDIPIEDVRHFQTNVTVTVDTDTFVIAEVVGTQSTFPILPGAEVPSIEISKALASLGESLGMGFGGATGNLRPEKRHITQPYALTNPIFVDADADGRWEPIFTMTSPVQDKNAAASHGPSATRNKSLLPPGAKIRHPLFELPADASPADIRRIFLNYSEQN